MTNRTDQQGLPDFEQPINPFQASSGLDEATQSTLDGKQLNPWFSMLSDPRTTVRQLVDTSPTRYVLLLAALGGISANLVASAISLVNVPSDRMIFLVVAALLGGCFGLASLYVMSWAFAIAGWSLGGVARALQCRTAMAWSQVPFCWLLPLFAGVAIYCALRGSDLLVLVEADGVNDEPYWDYPSWLRGALGLSVVASIWQIALLAQSLGEVHQFSSLRGLAIVFLAGILVGTVTIVGYVPLSILLFSLR